MELGSGVVPADDPLPGIDLLEHGGHQLKVLVVQVPDLLVFVLLVKRNGERVGDVQLKYLGLSQIRGNSIYLISQKKLVS